MTYRTRIGILIAFIIFFLATAPIVVLYTAGYRWNTKKGRPEKVGIIFVRARPSGSDIYLDGKLRSETTPTRLRNLLPDTYTITIGKNGYGTWTKRLQVSSGLTTFAEGVIIWKNATPEPLTVAPSEVLNSTELDVLKRDDQRTYTANGETFRTDGFEIWVENKNGEHETVTRLSEEIRSIVAYTDPGWIIYETADAIHAIERDNRDVKNDITLAIGNNLNGLAVSSDGKTLYFLAKKDGATVLWKRLLQ